jgi:hypothetical protein
VPSDGRAGPRPVHPGGGPDRVTGVASHGAGPQVGSQPISESIMHSELVVSRRIVAAASAALIAVCMSATPLRAQAAATTAGSTALTAPTAPTIDKSEIRTIIAGWNERWGKARLALDSATLERMLPPDYYAVFGGERMDRATFIEGVLNPPAGIVLRRFDPAVLSVHQSGDEWIAVIEEKLEVDRTGEDGTVQRTYHLWIIKDVWKQVDGEWVLVSGEVVSNEGWRGGSRPPFEDWDE